MARPRTVGLPYFPFNTRFNERAQCFLDTFHNDGMAFLVKFWQGAYQSDDGCLELCGVLRRRMFSSSLHITEETLTAMIDSAAELNLIDPETWKRDQKLTSNGIRRRLNRISDERERARLRQEISYAAKNNVEHKRSLLKGKRKEEKETKKEIKKEGEFIAFGNPSTPIQLTQLELDALRTKFHGLGETRIIAELEKASDWLSSSGKRKKDHAAFMRLWLGKCFEQNGNGKQQSIPLNKAERQSQIARELMTKYKEEEDEQARNNNAVDADFQHVA